MVSACRNRYGRNHLMLDSAEILTPIYPDSALALLESIPVESLTHGEEAARHALLLTQARYKCMQDETEDSLIRVAVSWYDNSKEERYRMLANFYLGYILKNQEAYGESVRHMLIAADLATQLKDTFHMAMANRYLYALSNDNHNFRSALMYATKEYDLMKASRGLDEYTVTALCDVATAHANNNNTDSALRITKDIIEYSVLRDDTVSMVMGLHIRAISCLRSQLYGKAIECFKRISEFGENYLTDSDIYNFVFCALKQEDNALADSIVGSLDMETQRNAVPEMYWVVNKEMSKAGATAIAILDEYDRMLNKISAQEVPNAESEYQRMKADEAIMKKKEIMTYAVVISCLLFSIIVYGLSMSRIKKAKTMELFAVINNISLEKNELIEKHFQRTNRLCEHLNAKTFKIDIDSLKSQLKTDIRDFCSESEAELISSANLRHPNMLRRFDEEYKDLNPNDRQLFIYHLCGFSPITISVFFGCNIQSVYTRKSRLKSRITGSESLFKDEFLKILS